MLYIWSSIFGLVLVAEFWLLANDLFNAREAKRLFPLIGAGAILGGVAGGVLSRWLAQPLGSANLLYLVAAMLLVAAATARLAWCDRPGLPRTEVPADGNMRHIAAGMSLVRQRPYVRLIAAMVVCMTLCGTLVQWQYKGVAKHHFGSQRDEMTAFFGT